MTVENIRIIEQDGQPMRFIVDIDIMGLKSQITFVADKTKHPDITQAPGVCNSGPDTLADVIELAPQPAKRNARPLQGRAGRP